MFTLTESTHGGTGFYIKDDIDYIRRDDLQFNSPSNHESTFIELQFPIKKNLIMGCVYWNPSSNVSIQDFSNQHLGPTVQRISSENKQCVLMGDFNIHLLNQKLILMRQSVISLIDVPNFFYTICSSHN